MARIVRAAALALLVCGAMLFLPAHSEPGFAPFPHAVNVIPAATPTVGNCLPLANNTDFGFSGFIYRNVPPFAMKPGTRFAFDLGGLNDVDVRRNIYFATASKNPALGNGNVRALAWTKVVSETQVPGTPRGNTIVGDYELMYTSEAEFKFDGGGFIIGFSASPPAAYADRGCEQVLVHTTVHDPSANFYARFWNKPNLDNSFLDRVSWSTTFIPGFVIFGDTIPPVVSADVSHAAGADGWIETTDPVTVTFTGVDEASGIDSCSAPVQLTAPGTHEVEGSCTDGAGNVGTTSVTVRIARRVEVDANAYSPQDAYNAKRAGPSTFAVKTSPDFNALSIDPGSATFGATGAEASVESCRPFKGDLYCRFDVGAAGAGDELHFKAMAEGLKVYGSAPVRLVGAPAEEPPPAADA